MSAAFATLFAGFGGAEIGAAAAGLTLAWGIEHDDSIAAVARQNGHPTITADACTTDYTALAPVGWLHASPPCPSFSVASGGSETSEDVQLAEATCRAIRELGPPWFSLENVRGYQGSESLRLIHQTLRERGYTFVQGVLCAADYGVPQHRRRLILVASRVKRPRLPVATHAEHAGQGGLFGPTLLPWVGWYEAVEDLLPAMPDTKLAPWQLKRLPEELRTMLVGQGGRDGKVVTAESADPAFTLTANSNQTALKAVMIHTGNTSDVQSAPGVGVLSASTPANVVSTAAPHNIRAVLIDSQQTAPAADRSSRRLVTYAAQQPAFTVPASVYKGPPRAVLAHRVVQMTTRALARFQSFPDTYMLPARATLACRGIGNAVPPPMQQRIIEAQC